MPEDWYDEHLARLRYRMAKSMRRAEAVTLVQWAAGGSAGDAASYLGIRLPGATHQFAPDLAHWLREHGTDDFTAALRSLAAQLDSAPGLTNYQHRRQAMREWCLESGTWQQLTTRLAPVPGPVKPILDDRKRQEASAFTWAYVTQGEPRFAPHPIQASQPEDRVGQVALLREKAVLLVRLPGCPTPNWASSSSSTATVSRKTSTTASEIDPWPTTAPECDPRR